MNREQWFDTIRFGITIFIIGTLFYFAVDTFRKGVGI